MIYLYEHPISKQVIEVVQKMNDSHEYVDKEGIKWLRVFSRLSTNIPTRVDPFSSEDWMRKTKEMKCSLGDMWDKSKELSEQRTKIIGKDPLKEKAIRQYRKKTKKPHPYENS